MNLQIAAVARVLSEAKFDRLGSPNRFGGHLDVLRGHENIVRAAGPAGRSANRDRAVKLRPEQAADLPFLQIQRLIELGNCALGSIKYDHSSLRVVAIGIGGKEDDRAGKHLDSSIRQIVILLHQELRMIVLQLDRIVQLP